MEKKNKPSPIIRSGEALRIFTKNASFSSKVLDCGCTDGTFIRQLESAGFKDIYGSDVNDYGLKNFKKVDFSIDKLPYEDNTFDIVTVWETIEHLENPFHFIREAKRVLKPQGKIIFSIPNPYHWTSRLSFMFTGKSWRWHKDKKHLFFPPKGVLQKFLSDFEVVKLSYVLGDIKLVSRIGIIRPFIMRINKIPVPANELFGVSLVGVLKK